MLWRATIDGTMTLNITFATPDAIYQSSEYRLSNPLTGERVDVRGHKVATVAGIPGLVCFTGVASTSRGQYVGSWMAEQLPQMRLDVTFDEAVERLRRADDWLRHLRRDSRQISFTLASWDAGRPRIALISNFQEISGRMLREVTSNSRSRSHGLAHLGC